MGALTFPLTFGLNKAPKTTFSLTGVAQVYGLLLASADPHPGQDILLEDGTSFLLLEDGSKILLE